MLKRQAEYLAGSLEEVKKRLANLESQPASESEAEQ
jgi:hypothetical protein